MNWMRWKKRNKITNSSRKVLLEMLIWGPKRTTRGHKLWTTSAPLLISVSFQGLTLARAWTQSASAKWSQMAYLVME